MAPLTSLAWILVGSLLMASIAMSGSFVILIPPRKFEKLLLPLISLAAGSLLGGAFFHMLPEGIGVLPPRQVGMWLGAGFTSFLALEQFLQWHHSHRASSRTKRPVGLLILLGDGLHNFIGGLGIASTFLLNPAAGLAAWLAAVAHELPQELGDFGILVHSGWSPRSALCWNLISALTFPAGAILAWLIAGDLSLAGLILFASGNFIYIAASDLVPEIKSHANPYEVGVSFVAFSIGMLVMLLLALQHG